MDTLLRIASDQRASDLHLHAGKVPHVRHDGRLVPLPFRELGMHQLRVMLDEVLDADQRDELREKQHIDFAYEVEGVGRFRGSITAQTDGYSAVFRVIPATIRTLAELDVPAVIGSFARHANGLVLVTGPTGSGKTTTLAALVDLVNESTGRHIITIEDPIEFVHPRKRGLVTQREVGVHVETFAGGLRSALREAPDVLVVGEMRDYETVSLALAAAEAGVLVFATLHTGSAAKAVDRLLGACPADQQDQVREILAALLRGVLSQRLCRGVVGGRVAACEILLQNIAVSNLIRESKVHQIDAYLRSGEQASRGMCGLEESLMRLVRERRITASEALSHSNEPEALRAALGTEAA
ncbi:MAG: PilT/PilU family type 4a pilus ATPase [Sandaracinus sp.]|nr:PilT/PilU family type 4a pilus ATPase [Sandaracinus sp.]MCB9635376.1 PilT/PilU family type 4a pilus ATPase [Sandaracinus sp.]